MPTGKAVFQMSIMAISCLSLTACFAAGKQVTEEQLAQFVKGKSTKGEVLAKLGQPNSNSVLPDGSRYICYSYTQVTTRPESFIPVVGAFVGGADTMFNYVCMAFDRSDILQSFTATASQSGSGRGFESGTSPKRIENEPQQAK
jgi:hypothetical protein